MQLSISSTKIAAVGSASALAAPPHLPLIECHRLREPLDRVRPRADDFPPNICFTLTFNPDLGPLADISCPESIGSPAGGLLQQQPIQAATKKLSAEALDTASHTCTLCVGFRSTDSLDAEKDMKIVLEKSRT
jgi:hypothetical protein